jgi:hypothetical protein
LKRSLTPSSRKGKERASDVDLASAESDEDSSDQSDDESSGESSQSTSKRRQESPVTNGLDDQQTTKAVGVPVDNTGESSDDDGDGDDEDDEEDWDGEEDEP